MDFDSTPATFSHWAEMIDAIRGGSMDAIEDLYTIVSDGARPKLLRQLGPQHADDRLHEVIVILLSAIYRGDLREPDRFLGFMRTIIQRRVCAHIRSAILSRKLLVPIQLFEPAVPCDEWPEARVLAQERADAARSLLGRLSPRDREILVRFYYLEQDRRQICDEMGLTDTQFRLFKSRAIARCSDLARRFLHASWYVN